MAFTAHPPPTFAEDLESLRNCARRMDGQKLEERFLYSVMGHLEKGHVLTDDERKLLKEYLYGYECPPSKINRPHHDLLAQRLGIDPATLYRPNIPKV